MFAHDKYIFDALVHLINHTPATVDDLDDFWRTFRFTGARDRDAAELEAVRALVPILRPFWDISEAEVVELLNQLLAEAGAVPRLVRHDGFEWHIHATSDDAPFDVRIRVEVAMAMLDLVRDDELWRLKVCAGEDCDDVLIDYSRNRSRRYCDGTCGNNAHVTAYRARRAAAGE